MPIIAVVHLAFAIFFAVHAMRTGRPMYWLFILLAFPMLGSIVYFLAEYLPGMRNTRDGAKAIRTVHKLVNPGRELREATAEYDRTPTAYNQAQLARALIAEGRLAEGIEHLLQAASGPYATDRSFLKSLADALLRDQRFADACNTLERLFAAHPDEREGPCALMHAEALAGARRPEARAAFEAIMARSGSIEAQSKYGSFLLDQGDKAGARAAFEAVLGDAKRGHRHSRELNHEWIAQARRGLAAIDA